MHNLPVYVFFRTFARQSNQVFRMMKIVFATNNAHKLEEARQILGKRVETVSLRDIGCTDDIAETATTLAGNSELKARYIYDKYGLDCFADDTGMEVEALEGAPGVYSARYAGEPQDFVRNRQKVLREMEGKENRKACFRTVITLLIGGEMHQFEGRVDGFITREEHGTGGFGYDSIFRPEGYEVTFAELTAEEKNRISHRGRAIERLCTFLNGQESKDNGQKTR